MHPRQSDAFFTPVVPAMGAVERQYKTRKGNTARWACYQLLTPRPPSSLNNGVVDFSKSQQGAIHV